MKYEIRNANGRICCMTDRFAHLCDGCQQRARSASSGASGVVPRKPEASAVPPPPDLTAAIRQRRGMRLTAAQREAELRKYFAVRQPMADGSRP